MKKEDENITYVISDFIPFAHLKICKLKKLIFNMMAVWNICLCSYNIQIKRIKWIVTRLLVHHKRKRMM